MPINKNSKIYIAGHRELVGSAIVKNLEAKGYTNLVYRTHSELDLTNQQAVSEFFESEKPEYVILAAAKVGGIVANNTYRADFIYENLAIQNNVIHQSYVHKVKKLLFLGSTCIYPKEAPQPMPEDCLLTSPLEYTNEPYAIAKIAGIKMCESYNIQYGTNFISVMPTNLYGPNDNFDLEKSHVLPALLRKMHLGKLLEDGNMDGVKSDLIGTQADIGESKVVIGENSTKEELFQVLNHYGLRITNHDLQNSTHNSQLTTHEKPSVSIEIWGTGLPRREFLWSEDMADACVYLMENIDFKEIVDSQCSTHHSPLTTNEVRNTHINIGTGIDVSIRDLAYMIKDLISYKGELTFNTDKPDGTMKKLTDVTKLNSLGWKYKMDLETGIKEMHEWYLSKYKV